jgi:hypothetical protein
MEVEKKNEHLSHKAQADYDLVLKAVNDDDQQAYTILMERYRNSIPYDAKNGQ